MTIPCRCRSLWIESLTRVPAANCAEVTPAVPRLTRVASICARRPRVACSGPPATRKRAKRTSLLTGTTTALRGGGGEADPALKTHPGARRRSPPRRASSLWRRIASRGLRLHGRERVEPRAKVAHKDQRPASCLPGLQVTGVDVLVDSGAPDAGGARCIKNAERKWSVGVGVAGLGHQGSSPGR